MKANFFSHTLGCILLFTLVLGSCKKDKNNNTGNTSSSLDGSWQTTVWGGANDTARMNISTGTGTLTYLNPGAAGTKFSVNDVIYSNIVSTGTNVYTATATYRYTPSSGIFNDAVSNTSAAFTLNGTALHVVPILDASTGITPPEYYWYKQ